MNRSMKLLSGVGAVAVMTMALGVEDAAAGWGSHGSSGGSHGGRSGWASHGSSGGSWGSHGSSGGSWGSHGSSGGSVGHHRIGFFRRLFKSHRHYHGHYGVSHSSWGSSGGSWGSHGSSGGSWGSSGGSWGSSAPSMYAPSESEYAPSELPGPADEAAAARGEALLAVQVPESARIYVNGRPTTSTGSFRQYMSRGLSQGMSYTYEVRAEAVIDGQRIEQTKTVKLHAGETANVAFDLAARPETSLTLRVPANARVILAGQETNGSGAVRVFRTSALEAGEEWSDYEIRVLVNRDGETEVREEKISLKGGESRTLDLQLETPKIAAAR